MLKKYMLRAGLMLTLASVQGAPDPRDVVFLDGWQEKVNRLKILGDPYDRDACFVDLVLFIFPKEPTQFDKKSINFYTLRPHLIEKMDVFPRGKKLDFLKQILSQVDGYLIEDLLNKIHKSEPGDMRGRVLSDFRKFVNCSDRNAFLQETLNEIDIPYIESLIVHIEARLRKSFFPEQCKVLIDFFRSRMSSDEPFSERILDEVADQIKSGTFPPLQEYSMKDSSVDILKKTFMMFLRSPEAKMEIFKMLVGTSEPGMALRVAKDGKSIETFRPAGGIIIKATLSRSFTLALEDKLPLPMDICSTPHLLSSEDHSISIPAEGVYFVRGLLSHCSNAGLGYVYMRINKNGSCLIERYIPFHNQSSEGYWDIEASELIKLKRGDKLTLYAWGSGLNPLILSTAELSVVFVGEYL